MKNLFLTGFALGVAFLITACGQQKTPAPAPQAGTPASAPAVEAIEAQVASPAGLPPCPELIALESASGDDQAGTFTLLSRQTETELLDFYTTTLSADGWVLGISVKQAGTQHLGFRKGVSFLRFQISPAGTTVGATQVQLAWGQIAGAQAVEEAHDPEYEEAPADFDGGGLAW